MPAWAILRQAMWGYTPQIAAWLWKNRNWRVTPRYLGYLMQPPADVDRFGFLQRSDDLRSAIAAVNPAGAEKLEQWFQGGAPPAEVEPETALLELQQQVVTITRLVRSDATPDQIEEEIYQASGNVVNLRRYCERKRSAGTDEAARGGLRRAA